MNKTHISDMPDYGRDSESSSWKASIGIMLVLLGASYLSQRFEAAAEKRKAEFQQRLDSRIGPPQPQRAPDKNRPYTVQMNR